MIITVTSIKLRSVWYYFRLTIFGFNIVKQLKTEAGFIKMKNTGFGYDHYTLSVWETPEDQRRFAKRGAHAEAIRQAGKIATEVRTYTYNSESIPGWKEAKELLKGSPKVYKFQ